MANYPAFQPMNAYQPNQMMYGTTPYMNGMPMAQVDPAYQQRPYTPALIPQPQPVQQTATVPQVRGRIVTREEEIVPSEVTMDGQVSLFPLADYSCIIAKLWDSNGVMQTFKFVPMVEQVVEEQVETKGDMILGRLDEIESLLKRNNHRQSYKKNQNGSRNEDKEVGDA